MPVAVVLDCDGTLVDSERVTRFGMEEALGALGHTLTDEDFGSMVGHPWPRSRAYLADRFGLTDDDVARMRDLMADLILPLMRDDAIVFPDVVALLDELAAADVPVAVCTSSGREHLARVLALPSLQGRFAAEVAREDVVRHKPDPLPYRTAIQRLAAATGRALDPAGCTVVEDSHVGVAAGLAAGCWTVGIDRGLGLHDLSAADVVVDRLNLAVLVRP